MNKKESEIKQATKDKELKISVTFDKNGESFQNIIEKILISKILKK